MMDFQDYIPYLTINGISKHMEERNSGAFGKSNAKWNEQNQGYGLIGKNVDGDLVKTIGMGQYLNSLERPSNYAAVGLQKRLLNGPYGHLDLGGRAGLVTGYDVPLAPMLQPLLTLGLGSNTDINLGYQPKVPGITPEVWMLNMDYRLK